MFAQFAVFCLLLLFSLGHCQDNELPSRFEIESSINRTIEEVERQVRVNPSLPRLTRQEIVNILENITSQDLYEFKDKEKFEKARDLYQRALMVVLPYSANESPGNLRDLYTKPPMTKIIPDFLISENDKNKSDEGKTKKENNNVENSERLVTENLIVDRNSYKTISKESTTMKNHYKNHRDTYSEVRTKVPLKESLKLDSTPIRFTFNLENLQKNAFTTEKTTTRQYPIYRNSGSNDTGLEIVYSTSVTHEPTTKPASKEITIDLERSKVNQNILTSSQWRYNAPPSTIMKPTLPSKLDKIPFLPTINVQPEDHLTVSSTSRPEVLMRDTSTAENLMSSSEKPTSLFVTPMSTETSSKVKYSSTYSLNSAGFRQAPTTTTTTSTTTATMPMRPEVMDLLASIGLRLSNSSMNVEDVYKKNKDILESKVQVADLNSIHSMTSAGNDAVSIVNQNAFESPGSEIKKGVENLTPDVQLLFKKFGLETSNLAQPTTSTTEKTTINLNSYTNFKPLPTSSVKNQEMREFLAKFGLGINDNRRQKSMKPSTEAPSVIEAVPNNMRGILENIGLISNSQKLAKTVVNSMEDMESTETSKYHVFKPHEAAVDNEEQRNKINELLDTVKLVQEGKANIQNVKKVANDLLQTTKILKDGPDPLKLEEIIRNYNEQVRNEVKRQQENQEEKEASTVTTTEQTVSPSSITTGIKKFMIYVLGGTEFWVQKIVQGLTKLRNLLINVYNKIIRRGSG